MSNRPHWRRIYDQATNHSANVCVLTRAGGYCLAAPIGARPKLNWLHECADPDDLPFVLDWLGAGDDEHPITWRTKGIALDARQPRFGMSKMNAGPVAVCIFHSDSEAAAPKHTVKPQFTLDVTNRG